MIQALSFSKDMVLESLLNNISKLATLSGKMC